MGREVKTVFPSAMSSSGGLDHLIDEFGSGVVSCDCFVGRSMIFVVHHCN
jgi:hypothetical protein